MFEQLSKREEILMKKNKGRNVPINIFLRANAVQLSFGYSINAVSFNKDQTLKLANMLMTAAAGLK